MQRSGKDEKKTITPGLPDGRSLTVVCPSPELGGAEGILKNMASAALALGWKVRILFLRKGDLSPWQELRDAAMIQEMPGRGRVASFFRLARLLREGTLHGGVDVIMSSHVYTNALICFLKRVGLLRRACLITRDSTVFSGRFKGWRLLAYKCLFKLYGGQQLHIAQSEEMLHANKTLAGRPPAKAIVMRNPVDAGAILRLSEEPVQVPGPYALAVGRLIPEKGFDLLLEAFASLRAENRETIPYLLILGEGPERSRLESIIAQKGLGECVLLPGRVENPYRYMSRSLVNLVPSRREGFPNVLHEMLVCHPRVACTTCVQSIASIPGVETCLPDDAEGFAEAAKRALSRTIDRDEQLRYLGTLDRDAYFRKAMSLAGVLPDA